MAEVHPEDATNLVRVLRTLRGWSQQQLAERSGIDESSVRRYESGRTVPLAAMIRLGQAAGVPEHVLFGSLLPLLRYLRLLMGGGPSTDRLTDSEFVEQEASWAVEQMAAEIRGKFMDAWAEHVQELEEREANSWRPVAAHREEAIDLWQRLEPLTSSERDLLLRHGTSFHSWAIVELVANQAAEETTNESPRALTLAELAVKVANLVKGSEAWKARVRAYAIAALGKALWATGNREAAQEARSEAERLWAAGVEEPGLLEEEKFRAALARTTDD